MKKSVKKNSESRLNATVYKRPSWDEYFIEIMETVANRATCDRGRSGCVIARDKQILTTGYVGSPPGIAHCDEIGHQIDTVINKDGTKSEHCIRTTHAEQNALAQAAKLGILLNGAILYSKMTPCYTCAKMIIAVGIKKVISQQDYHASQKSKEIFKKTGVELKILNKNILKYDK